jgi:hypothetical protein
VLNSELRASTHVVEAEWLTARLRPFGSGVASVVPDGFAAYVRILHPARAAGVKDEPVTWAEVAARSGGTMHRLVQFHAIARTNPFGTGSPSFGVSPPESGNLPPHLLTVLCAILAEHTSTDESCWFCLWDGYGWIHGSPAASVIRFTPPGDTSASAGEHSVPPGLTAEVLQGPKVSLPHREYFLFNGPLHAARELGWTTPWGFYPQSPNLLWPQDHAWCVATEIDLFCTLVAGSEQLAEALMADPRLEAWRVFPDDPVTSDSDKVNT